MTLERLIASRALELVQLLEHYDDGEVINRIVAAVASCDYAELETLENWSESDE